MWGLGTLPEGKYQKSSTVCPIDVTKLIEEQLNILTGFPAAAYAAYAAGRGYSGYPSFGLPYPTGKIHFCSIQM